MKIKNILLFGFLVFSLNSWSQKDKDVSSIPLDSIVKDLQLDEGLITAYFDFNDQKLLLSIPTKLIGKDLLMVSRYVKLPANYSAYVNAGSKTSEAVIRFEKLANRIVLKQLSYVAVANETDPIHQSVVVNNFPPILASFEIKNEEEESFLIDAKDYFSADSPGFNIIGSTPKKNFGIGSLDKSRSWIDSVKSFDQNLELTHTLTYSASKLPRSNQTQTLSFQVNHSIIMLPEDPMPIRYTDHRVGWFSLQKYNYSSEALKSDEYQIAKRWRLEPTDKEAYQRGELVEPIKPIIYYLDPATPLKWRPYFKQGIEDWNTAFEKAGFKNAIIAKDPPTKEEDPDFSPEDIRYSTVRYVASTTRNAVGPSVSDPRTGEIIESDIIWYHNHLRSYRNRYLLETAAANPKARTLATPDEEIGEMMRRVISHEIGHALGLPHNMKASSAYPVDSLRSGSFTQKMGIATTIMDYARYNYIAQPEDENIRFVRQLGPYDKYAIAWGYRYFNHKSPEEIKAILSAMVDEKSLDPIYMFGSYGTDPNSQTENIGDDPVKATAYGLKNLKVVAKNLEEWTTNNGASYDDLKELYGELLSVYSRYINHVAALIGGVHETRINKGQNAIPYRTVSKSHQKAALASLQENLWKSPLWLLDATMISNFTDKGGLDRISNIQRAVLHRIVSTSRLNQMLSTQNSLLGTPLLVSELIDELEYMLLRAQSNPDLLERNLQINWTIRLQELLEDKQLNPEVAALLQASLARTHTYFKSRRSKGNQLQKNHYTYGYTLSKPQQ